MCKECYIDNSRITPLLNPVDCLSHHTQYICGTCGRCICIERDLRRGLQRWNFPFQSLEQAKLYLLTADVTMKKSCGIYEIKSSRGRISYKIFPGDTPLFDFIQRGEFSLSSIIYISLTNSFLSKKNRSPLKEK